MLQKHNFIEFFSFYFLQILHVNFKKGGKIQEKQGIYRTLFYSLYL